MEVDRGEERFNGFKVKSISDELRVLFIDKDEFNSEDSFINRRDKVDKGVGRFTSEVNGGFSFFEHGFREGVQRDRRFILFEGVRDIEGFRERVDTVVDILKAFNLVFLKSVDIGGRHTEEEEVIGDDHIGSLVV